MRLMLLLTSLILLTSCIKKTTSTIKTLENLTQSQLPNFEYANNKYALKMEVFDNNTIHFNYSSKSEKMNFPIPLSPMVKPNTYSLPIITNKTSNSFETPVTKLEINPLTLCVNVIKKENNLLLTQVCPTENNNKILGINLSRASMLQVYGLGQSFLEGVDAGNAENNWNNKIRNSGNGNTQACGFGNCLKYAPGTGGSPGNIQIPIFYATGNAKNNYAFFLDNTYKHSWNFTTEPWHVDFTGGNASGFIFTGDDLPALRKSYLRLVGGAKLPPKKIFGLWMSEFSYFSFAELIEIKNRMQQKGFPLDGFFLDLAWFGSVSANDYKSNMGNLWFSEDGFAGAENSLKNLKDNYGIGVIPIEESYVSWDKLNTLRSQITKQFPGYYLAHDCQNPDNPIELSAWWGKGVMLDWTNKAATEIWHDAKRQRLVNAGVIGHWLDLGEPEMFNSSACYKGIYANNTDHASIHNIYNFKWAESIYDGYQRNEVKQRIFLTARSGAAGMQRFGAGIWSGDISGALESLAGHIRSQVQMFFSGFDYYTSDIGGFHRKNAQEKDLSAGEEYRNYTLWYAAGMLFDYPARPHVWNMDLGGAKIKKGKNSAPDLIGDLNSNRENTILRYKLIPYMYSVAQQVWENFEPLIAPIVYYFEQDLNVRDITTQKMLGPSLMAGAVTYPDSVYRDMYFPAGEWINFHTGEAFVSKGETLKKVPIVKDGQVKLPLFAKSGAIIPLMPVDAKTQNALGKRTDNSVVNNLILRIFPFNQKTSFNLYEDDGETTAYLQRENYKLTTITQEFNGENNELIININKPIGGFQTEMIERTYLMEVAIPTLNTKYISHNNQQIPKCNSLEITYLQAHNCWYQKENYLYFPLSKASTLTNQSIQISFQPTIPSSSLYFVCNNAHTSLGESVYVTGNTTELGNWNPLLAKKMWSVLYPRWTFTLDKINNTATIQWKCLKINDQKLGIARNNNSKLDSKDIVWSTKTNSSFTPQATSGFLGTTESDF